MAVFAEHNLEILRVLTVTRSTRSPNTASIWSTWSIFSRKYTTLLPGTRSITGGAKYQYILVLLRLPRVLFLCSSVFLSFRFALGCTSTGILFYAVVLFCFACHIISLRKGHDTSSISFYLFAYYQVFDYLLIFFISLSLSFFCHCIVYSAVVILLSTRTALQCSVSVSWFCDRRACISLGGRIGADNGWVCWMSTGTKHGLTWTIHSIT